ncbi:hypothetical protein K0J45_03115 [Shewanella alkalitolerans]|uniref:hypothetical protein n=1 Tax=Shewanella alkalitolerans TaxID=2864209 RepID=UPI001C655616|nr:hypothetical protein [Shewanella alkalitolerans]QYJ98247.1 hypothetical protein K0J45_03115 [Shewanella alkalitolerans]
MAQKENKDCFIIMPISDADGYDKGHFERVYEDIIKPAVSTTEFTPRRADEVKETNFIHLDILKKLIDAPIAICDLSSRNPNVLFELGIRQAFDKPVVLIQEKGTPKIFDIGPLRYLEYDKGMKYHDVLRTQKELTEAIVATKAAEGQQGNVNSIVRLMALSNPASIPTLEGDNKEAFAIDVLQTQLNDMRKMMEISLMENRRGVSKGGISSIEYERISNKLDKLLSTRKNTPREVLEKEFHRLMMETEELSMHCDEKTDHRMFRYLMERIHRAMMNEFDEE